MRSKNVFLNIITNIFSQLLIIVYGFIVPKIIISKFGSDVNGLISSITQFLGYIALLQSGFGPVVKSLLYKPISKKNNEEIANILYVSEKFFKRISKIIICYIILLSLLYPIVVINEFSYFYTFSLIIIISFSVFAEYYFGMTYRLFLQAEQKNYIVTIINSTGYLISLILVVVLTVLNFNIHFIKLATAFVFVMRPLLQNLYVKKKFNIKYNNVDKNYKIKQKWDGLAQHIASVIHDNTDITLLTIFKPLTEVSVYSVYYLVVRAINSFVESFCNGIDSSFGDMIAKNEIKNLNKKFNVYEVFYFIIVTILFSCTIVLITPFVSVYTRGITDADYIRYTFGYLIVIAIYIRSVREVYYGIIKAAGHFRETRIGAWVECITNIVISLLLVQQFGIVGVAIGTIAAMAIRTIEFVYHANRYILSRSILVSVKKIILIVVETTIIVFACSHLPYLENCGYIDWIFNAIMVFSVAIIVTLFFNTIFYKNELKGVLHIFRNVCKKKQDH